jgi:hypothetical protein
MEDRVAGVSKVVSVAGLHGRSADVEYWRSLPLEERVRAVTELRCAFFGVNAESGPRLEGVHRVLKRG